MGHRTAVCRAKYTCVVYAYLCTDGVRATRLTCYSTERIRYARPTEGRIQGPALERGHVAEDGVHPVCVLCRVSCASDLPVVGQNGVPIVRKLYVAKDLHRTITRSGNVVCIIYYISTRRATRPLTS